MSKNKLMLKKSSFIFFIFLSKLVQLFVYLRNFSSNNFSDNSIILYPILIFLNSNLVFLTQLN